MFVMRAALAAAEEINQSNYPKEESTVASIVRYEPFRFPLSEMTRDFDRALERLVDDSFSFPRGMRARAGAGSAANLYETQDAYWVELPLPGVKADDVEVTVQDNVLQLRAKREWSTPEGAKSIWQGFTGGTWEQHFTLPGEVNPDKVSATLEHGILRLELPKAEHTKPRTIRVNASGAPAIDMKPAAGNEASVTEQA
jgi:HSP20 family protein